MSAHLQDRELINEFVAEANEHLADVEGQLLTLEGQGDRPDISLVNTVFRAVHSVKGAAGFLGLKTINDLAHSLEEVLNRMRGEAIRPTSRVVEVLLRAIDRLQGLMRDIDNSNDADVSQHVAALEQLLNAPEATADLAADELTPEASPVETAAPSSTSDVIGEAIREFLVESYENLEQLDKDLIALEQEPTCETRLRTIFRTIHTIKGSAGFLGYTTLEGVTHAGENLLGAVRAGEIAFDGDVSSGLFSLVDTVRKLLAEIESGEPSAECDSLIRAMQELQQAKQAPRDAVAVAPLPNGFRELNAAVGETSSNVGGAGAPPSREAASTNMAPASETSLNVGGAGTPPHCCEEAGGAC